MFECLVMGDSIAVGIGMHRPECAVIAKVGITSEKWYKTNKHNPTFALNRYRITVISLGTNDFNNTTEENLYTIRFNVVTEKVLWILPSYALKPKQRAIIQQIAKDFNDVVIDINEHIGRDGIHPTGAGYKAVANKTKIY